jgi:hypothetical protein
VKHIEKRNRTGKGRERSLNILRAKLDIFVTLLRNAHPLPDFPCINIQSQDGLPAAAFTQIKREQANTASDIEDRIVRAGKKLIGRRINRVVTKFAPDIAPQPALGKLGGNAGTRTLMFSSIAGEVFHLIRIIALPD